MEDVGLREWLGEDGSHGNQGRCAAYPTYDHVSFSSVAWIAAKLMNLADGAFPRKKPRHTVPCSERKKDS